MDANQLSPPDSHPRAGSGLRITGIRTFLMQAGPLGASGWGDVKTSGTAGTRNWLFVKVDTDAGLTGIGEGSGWPKLVEAGIQDMAHVLIGEDPFDIERLGQRMTVATMGHGLTGVVGQGAIGAIDMALWDIKAKALGVPVWQLLGGQVRDRVRAYSHAATPEAARQAVARGYTAIKVGGVERTVARAEAIRAAVGSEVDVMIDLHGPPWLPTADAIAVCRALERLAPLFVEEPLAPENLEGYRRLRGMTGVPLAAGERHAGLFGVAPMLSAGLLDVVQPDPGRCGGITGLRKIAVLAEAGFATIAPHAGSLGPVAEIAALHVLAAIPNALILEKMDPDWEGRANTVTASPEVRDGHVMVPTAPGLGVDIDEAFVARHPHRRNAGLASGQWPPGTAAATLYTQPRHPRSSLLGRGAAGQEPAE